jgi:hypothetical protein
MSKARSRSSRKPPMKAVSRRVMAEVRAMSRGRRPLSLSDAEWGALKAAPPRRRARRPA